MKSLTEYLNEAVLFKLNGTNKFHDKVDIFDTLVPIKDEDDKYHVENKDELVLIINDKLKNNPKSLDLTDVDVSKLTSLENIGYGGGGYGTTKTLFKKLEEVDITGWDTSNVTNMKGFFAFCKLKTIKGIEDIDVSNVTDISWMLSDAHTDIDLSNLKFKKLKGNIYQSFADPHNRWDKNKLPKGISDLPLYNS